MSSLLGKIRGFVDNFATVISDMVDTDVIITDSNMDIVGSKFRYFSLYNDIKVGSLIADVIVNNHNLLIEDKSTVASCRECEEFDVCKIKGFVGVPIRYEKKVMGAIALILPRAKVKPLFATMDSTITFMENMADLVAVRMMNHMEKKGLKQKISQIESILDMMEDAVLYTDIYGNIIYLNRQFKTEFHADTSLIGKNIKKIYPEFSPWLEGNKKAENVKITIDYHGGTFYGLLNQKRVYVSEGQYGIIFSLRPYKNITSSSSAFIQGTIVTLPWLEKVWDSEWTELAKKYAQTEENLLIYSEENAMNELLAKAIANHSARRLNAIKIIYMQNVYRDLLDKFLLDEYGIIQNMDEGTLVIVQPEQMTLYVQNKLADFMRTGKLKLSGGKIVIANVRIIFCTTVDLKVLAKKGDFSKELYKEVSRNVISPKRTIHNNYQFFYKYCSAGLRYYCKAYNRKQKMNIPKLLEQLWTDCKNLPLGDIERVLECIARDGNYHGKDISSYDKDFKPNIISMKEMEEQQLKTLVEMGYDRKEMEEILKISRTTLYRKLKKYGLDVKKTGRGRT